MCWDGAQSSALWQLKSKQAAAERYTPLAIAQCGHDGPIEPHSDALPPLQTRGVSTPSGILSGDQREGGRHPGNEYRMLAEYFKALAVL